MKLCAICKEMEIPSNHKHCEPCKHEKNRKSSLAWHYKNSGRPGYKANTKVDITENYTPEHRAALKEYDKLVEKISDDKRRKNAPKT